MQLTHLLYRSIVCMLLPVFSFAQISFQEVPNLPFLDDEGYLRGISWIDVDNDNDLDVCVSGASGIPPNTTNLTAIYENQGNAVFVNNGWINSPQNNPMSHAWADINNDGDLDAYFGATWNQMGINELWLNDGSGNMTISQNSGATPNQALPYEGTVNWADYDNDGYVDLFLAVWNNNPNVLYHNNGDGTFDAVTTGAIVTDQAWTSGAIWGDYDNDNDLDLYVYNYQTGSDPGANDLFRNNGDGTFTKITTAGAVVNDAANTRTANWVDVNNDGFLDLFATNQGTPDRLYLNNTDGTFSDADVGPANTSWTSNWGDYDNDGDLDLFTIGLFGSDAKFWSNDGNGNFTDILESVPGIQPLETNGSNSNGIAFVDFNRDGWLDLHITQPNSSPDYLYRNEGMDCISWLEIKCTGVISNTTAIGAIVRAKTNTGGSSQWQMRQVSAQTSKPSTNPHWLHFGFGDAAVIDSLVVEWPSGEVCVFENFAVNQFVEIVEGSCETLPIIAPPTIPGENYTLTICDLPMDTTLSTEAAPGGTWAANCGNCIDQMGTFYTDGLADGQYEVTYSVGGICGSLDTYTITLGTLEGSTQSVDICSSATEVELIPSLAEGGAWSADCGNCIGQNGLFSTEGLAAGNYEAFYSIDTDCGLSTDTFLINLITADAGENTEAIWCSGDEPSNLTALLSGTPSAEGLWVNELFQAVDIPYTPSDSIETLLYIVEQESCTDTAQLIISLQDAPVVVASGDTTVSANEEVMLTASGALSYVWLPDANISCSACETTIFAGTDTTTLIVTGTNEAGCSAIDSVTINIRPEPLFEMPNVFTPNNDGVNDEYNAVSVDNAQVFASFELAIYNRWGQQVFQSTIPTEGWDGQHNGQPAATEVYFYTITYELVNGESGSRKGNLTLLR
jgi:gliding motility-associated-like protein